MLCLCTFFKVSDETNVVCSCTFSQFVCSCTYGLRSWYLLLPVSRTAAATAWSSASIFNTCLVLNPCIEVQRETCLKTDHRSTCTSDFLMNAEKTPRYGKEGNKSNLRSKRCTFVGPIQSLYHESLHVSGCLNNSLKEQFKDAGWWRLGLPSILAGRVLGGGILAGSVLCFLIKFNWE